MQNFKKIFISGIVWKFVFYVSSFCLNLLLANILGATGSGSFFYLLNNLSIVLLFLSFGLDSAITYTHAKKEFGSGHLLVFSITWSFLSTLLFTALMCAVAFTQLVEWNSHTLYIVLYVFSSILIALISAIFYASNNHIIPNLLPSITNLLLILYLLFYPYKEEQQVYETLVKAFLVAGIFTGLIFLIYANNKIRIISFKGLLNRKLLSYSWQFFVANIFVALLLRSDIWLIKHLCTYADLGNYIQTTKISQFILLLPNLASFTLLPLLTQSIEQNMAESKVLKLINLYFYLALFIIVIFILTGHWLFIYLYGASFYKMFSIFTLFIPGLLGLVCSYPLTPFFSGMNRNYIIAQTAAYATVLMLLTDIVLIPRFSIYGAAIGSTVAYLFYFLRLFFIFKKEKPSSWSKAFSFGAFYNSIRVLISTKLIL